ncbi:hypothetical protein F5X98DRAFT_333914 [Xylaria grammica]|nr:hypothetical protein F5X98DRAFT_333914 [Xylaria grammica]
MDRISDAHEEAPLLRPSRGHCSDSNEGCDVVPAPKFLDSPAAVLPIALISALAVAATAATQIYAYESMLCKDAHHCDDSERRAFAASVAIATAVANVCALLSIRMFEALGKDHLRLGLGIWLLVRSLSVVALALGVFVGNIGIAMFSQVFEGLASDNILHFILNTFYIQARTVAGTSRLIGSSLALYMIGISLSPSIASLLGNYRYSFAMAYGLFLVAFVYLLVCVRTPRKVASPQTGRTESCTTVARPSTQWHNLVSKFSSFTTSPIRFVVEDRWRLLPGLALFFYNAAQSYTFSALMVHTSVHFGFSSRENGFILTIVHAVASAYLFGVLFLVPKVAAFMERREHKTYSSTSPLRQVRSANGDDGRRNAYLALGSLLVQATALALVTFVRKPWQIYSISALLALGLACSGFIKSYFAASFDAAEKARALAYLALMESCGSLVAPIALGGLQTLWANGSVFIAATGCVSVASVLLFWTIVVDHRRS